MQNLVHATGRTVWYLNDPVEDNPEHNWEDYRVNWESTLVASLFQPEVWQYEVAPWPERAFGESYPKKGKPQERESMPPAYATEVQTVINALNNLKQSPVEWDCGTTGIGVLVSDSLMFQRDAPAMSDSHLSHVYGLALPLLKRGMPVTPVQLENVTIPHYLDGFRVLLLSYHGQKPLTSEVHGPLGDWVKRGGVLVFMDDDSDPYNSVREWWNTDGRSYATPREHLFHAIGISATPTSILEGQPVNPTEWHVDKGAVIWLRENPANLATSAAGDARLVEIMQRAATFARLKWHEQNYIMLRRGPYLIAAGLDESVAGEPKILRGRFVNLFDTELRVRESVTLEPGSRLFLLDLNATKGKLPCVLASACKTLPTKTNKNALTLTVEGVGNTSAVVLIAAPKPPHAVTLEDKVLETFYYSAADKLLWVRFSNEPRPRELAVRF